jgi:hypothetical protein
MRIAGGAYILRRAQTLCSAHRPNRNKSPVGFRLRADRRQLSPAGSGPKHHWPSGCDKPPRPRGRRGLWVHFRVAGVANYSLSCPSLCAAQRAAAGRRPTDECRRELRRKSAGVASAQKNRAGNKASPQEADRRIRNTFKNVPHRGAVRGSRRNRSNAWRKLTAGSHRPIRCPFFSGFILATEGGDLDFRMSRANAAVLLF